MEDLAREPGDRNTGHYNELVKLVVGDQLGNACTMNVECPMVDTRAGGRRKVQVPISLPSEWFAEINSNAMHRITHQYVRHVTMATDHCEFM